MLYLCFLQNDAVPEGAQGKSDAKRVGRLTLLCLGQLPSPDHEASEEDLPRTTELDLLHSSAVSAVLDIKWCDGVYGREQSGLPLFAAVDASGDVSLWSVNRAEMTGEAECQLLEILSTEDAGTMALSLDWSTVVCRRYVTYSLSLFVWLLEGRINILCRYSLQKR